MRPRTLDELVGQRQLLAAGSPLRRLVEGDQPMSLHPVGPAGHRQDHDRRDPQPADRPPVRRGLRGLGRGQGGPRGHRRRAQPAGAQPAARRCCSSTRCTGSPRPSRTPCCPGVENRWVTLVAATTENPFFSVISPLLSRSLLLTLEPLTDDDIRGVLTERAAPTSAAWAARSSVDDDALDHLVRLAGGDARRGADLPGGGRRGGDAPPAARRSTLEVAETAVDRAAVRYDRQGDQHYDVISAFIKSIRGSDVDAALHYLARMIEAGEDPRFIARRLVILASEDIGLADPTALTTAVAAAQAVQLIGMPEARLNLAQAVIALAVAPKSNAVIKAIDAATADVRAGQDRHGAGAPARRPLRRAKKLGPRQRLPYAHDAPFGVAEQQYAPRRASPTREYYRPTDARGRGRGEGALGAAAQASSAARTAAA